MTRYRSTWRSCPEDAYHLRDVLNVEVDEEDGKGMAEKDIEVVGGEKRLVSWE